MNTVTDIWQQLSAQGEQLGAKSLRQAFSEDSERFAGLSMTFDDMLYDFSKERLDQSALSTLLDLARASDLESKRAALFSGQKINTTEDRAVLHMALRGGVGREVSVDGQAVMPLIEQERERFLDFAEQVRSGAYAPVNGGKFTDVVNIGIGGSDLGPAMVLQALHPWHTGPKVHCVSNVDSAHIVDVLKDLDPNTTLVIGASKTFTTTETMRNLDSAVAWLKASIGEQSGHHLAAVSTSLEATRAYGIDDSRVFGFWDWVGGRYSVWSAIGLPVAIAVGRHGFEDFLAGAKSMDEHFCQAPLAQNLPVLMALVGIWRRNVMGCPSVALIPYDQRLARFTAYVQQLDMESNGKRTTLEGKLVERPCGPVIWGEPGTNAQHSFFQLLHQGEDIVPVDFIVAAKPSDEESFADIKSHHQTLLCNVLAQAQALAFGRTEDEVRAELTEAGLDASAIEQQTIHRTFPGNRPSSMLMYQQLNPFTLGRLIALFEHKVFVQGVVWGVNSYDQWGVELGKILAKNLAPAVAGDVKPSDADGSTVGLIEHFAKHK